MCSGFHAGGTAGQGCGCVCLPRSINPRPFLTRNIQNTLPARALASSGKQLFNQRLSSAILKYSTYCYSDVRSSEEGGECFIKLHIFLLMHWILFAGIVLLFSMMLL